MPDPWYNEKFKVYLEKQKNKDSKRHSQKRIPTLMECISRFNNYLLGLARSITIKYPENITRTGGENITIEFLTMLNPENYINDPKLQKIYNTIYGR